MKLHIQALLQACEETQTPYQVISQNGFVVEIQINDTWLPFVGNQMPLNNQSLVKLCQDKAYSYEYLHSVIRMPRTSVYIDPEAPVSLQNKKTHEDLDRLLEQILSNHKLPLILKRNSGRQGQHVYLCESKVAVHAALQNIFAKDQIHYDHVVLVQEYIQTSKEYRVIFLGTNLQLAYAKDISQANFTGNLSPLHWIGAKAVVQTDTELIRRLQAFLVPAVTKLKSDLVGADVIVDQKGKLWLLEFNTDLGVSYLVKDNGLTPVVELYKCVLDYLAQTSSFSE